MRRLLTRTIALALVPFACEQSSLEATSSTDVRRGPVHASVEIAPAEAAAGERITVRIEVVTEAKTTLTTPLLAIPENGTLGAFHVLSSSDTDDVPLEQGGRRWHQQLVLDSFEAGEHDFPSIAIAFRDGATEDPIAGSIETEPLTITITSALASSDTELKDIRGWIDIPSGPWWPWILAIGGGIVIVIIGGLWIAMRDRQTGPPPTAAEIARGSLRSLRDQDLLGSGNVDGFYTTLSSIVRQYIEGRFGIRAPRNTTAEFLLAAESDRRLTDSQRDDLKSFLRMADLVKFAMHEPAASQGTNAITSADHFVDEVETAFEQLESAPTTSSEVAPC
jgi:hypothetical protein